MDRAALQEFAQDVAQQRQSLWGVLMRDVATGRTFCGALAAVTRTRDLESGGWQISVTSTLRVLRSSAPWLTPALGQIFARADGSAYYRVAQINDNPASPEWVLGLADDESRP